jgi:putative transposase
MESVGLLRMPRRFVATTDGDHDDPIFPNRVNSMIVDRSNQLWIAT